MFFLSIVIVVFLQIIFIYDMQRVQMFCVDKRNKIFFKTKKSILSFISVLLVDFIILYVVKNFIPQLTIYEGIIILLSLTIVLCAIYHVVSDKKNSKNIILYMIYAFAVITACYSTLTFGRTIIHSDTATPILLARCQMENMSVFPENWCYVNGDIWLLAQNLFAILPTYLFRDQSMARVVQGVLWYLTAVVCMRLYFEKKLNSKGWLIACPITLVALYGELSMILYETAYIGCMIFMPLALWFSWNVFNSDKKRSSLLLCFVFFALLAIGGMRSLAEYSLPACAAFLIMWFAKLDDVTSEKDERKRYWRAILGVLIPSLIGIILYKYLGNFLIMNQTEKAKMEFVASIDVFAGNIVYYFKAIFMIFGYNPNVSLFSIKGIHNLVLFFLAVLICFVLPMLQIKCMNSENDQVKFLVYYGIIHNLIMFIMVAGTGKNDTPRYVLTSVFVCILISSRYIMDKWIETTREKSLCLTGIFAICIMVCSLVIVNLSQDWTQRLEDKRRVSAVLQEHDLEYGFASYWNAYSNVIYSNFDVKVLGIIFDQNAKPIPFRWLVDSEWFEEGDQYDKTFLMLTTDEANHMAENGAFELFGEPIEQFAIDETGLNVYVYDYNVMDVIE